MILCKFENGNIASPGLRHVTVGAIVIDGDRRVLLTKRSPNMHNGGKFTIPGGYVDRDETIEEAVLRELREETGYIGKIVKLFMINDSPNRPKEDRQNIDFIYIVNIIGGEPRLDKETSEILWFDKDNLPTEDEFAFDHRDIILKYFNELDF